MFKSFCFNINSENVMHSYIYNINTLQGPLGINIYVNKSIDLTAYSNIGLNIKYSVIQIN